jgi:hypothetical protein
VKTYIFLSFQTPLNRFEFSILSCPRFSSLLIFLGPVKETRVVFLVFRFSILLHLQVFYLALIYDYYSITSVNVSMFRES